LHSTENSEEPKITVYYGLLRFGYHPLQGVIREVKADRAVIFAGPAKGHGAARRHDHSTAAKVVETVGFGVLELRDMARKRK